MTLDELISMSIGDKIINCGNIWKLVSIHEYHKNCSKYYFELDNGDEYSFSIQVNHDWKTKTTFIYNTHDSDYYNLLDESLNLTELYSKETHIKILEEKNKSHFESIEYNNKKIEALRNQ